MKSKSQMSLVRGAVAVMLLMIPLTVLCNWSGGSRFSDYLREGDGAVEALESYVAAQIPFSRQLREVGLSLRVVGGLQEQDGIFFVKNKLMKNIAPGNNLWLEQNTEAILNAAEYAQEVGIPVYLALIPTASAIQEAELSPFAEPFNQRELIEATYARMYGKVSTVDLYTQLFSKRDQYLYYRTEHNLTAMGGYYIYETLGERLGVVNRSLGQTLGQYDIIHVNEEYYGGLYKAFPYKNVDSDILMQLHYIGSPGAGKRGYMVTHRQGGEEKVYHTVYPNHLAAFGREMDCYLGGLSAVIDIETTLSVNRSLLVFGDETALTYLPLLCNHYQKITLVDLRQETNDFKEVYPEEYSQILFAYSVENFWDNDASARVTDLLADKGR